MTEFSMCFPFSLKIPSGWKYGIAKVRVNAQNRISPFSSETVLKSRQLLTK